MVHKNQIPMLLPFVLVCSRGWVGCGCGIFAGVGGEFLDFARLKFGFF